MMFASKTPDDIIRTPEDEALIAAVDFCSEEVYGLIPSKFYNMANPILRAFRDYVAWAWVYLPNDTTYAEDVRAFDGLRDDSFIGTTPEQIDHARRVLTRLANLTNDKEN